MDERTEVLASLRRYHLGSRCHWPHGLSEAQWPLARYWAATRANQ